MKGLCGNLSAWAFNEGNDPMGNVVFIGDLDTCFSDLEYVVVTIHAEVFEYDKHAANAINPPRYRHTHLGPMTG